MYRELALQINNNCNLKCPFCFSDKTNEYIAMNNVECVKDFCKREKVDTIKITGGEPFLHPDIHKIIDLFIGFDIFIFSNLTIKNCIINIADIDKIKSLTILVNLNEPQFYSKEVLNDIYNNINIASKLGIKIILGRTFYQEPFYIDDIIKLCIKHNITTIRVSQASPKESRNNQWLSFEETNLFLHKMYEFDRNILSYNNIKLHFDCPVKPCKVDKEIFNYFFDKKTISYKCRPRIFVGYDLKIKHCYANEVLYPENYLYHFSSYQDIFEYIEKTNIGLASAENKKCVGCKYFSNIPCGCLSGIRQE